LLPLEKLTTYEWSNIRSCRIKQMIIVKILTFYLG